MDSPIQLIVSASISGYGFYAYKESEGEENAQHGWTIQDAIESLMETLCEQRAAKADPNDKSFVYEIPYKWRGEKSLL